MSFPGPVAFALVFALAGCNTQVDGASDATVEQQTANPQGAATKAFLDRIQEYVAFHNNVEKMVPALKETANPEEIAKREAALGAALIKQRTARFASAKTDKEAGAKLFAKHCAACHRIGDQGGKVGPNLDGVGVRGLERLLEDTLDPNRNVDAAFRARVLNLTDGTTKTGLQLRTEGQVLVFADNEGKEFRVSTQEVETNRETNLSPMPANVADIVPEAEFRHLMAYLLAQRAAEVPKK